MTWTTNYGQHCVLVETVGSECQNVLLSKSAFLIRYNIHRLSETVQFLLVNDNLSVLDCVNKNFTKTRQVCYKRFRPISIDDLCNNAVIFLYMIVILKASAKTQIFHVIGNAMRKGLFCLLLGPLI